MFIELTELQIYFNKIAKYVFNKDNIIQTTNDKNYEEKKFFTWIDTRFISGIFNGFCYVKNHCKNIS